jgi:hypothetical protein
MAKITLYLSCPPIDEVIVSGDYGFARTNSKVKTTIPANRETIYLENKELFVLHKNSGQWKNFSLHF